MQLSPNEKDVIVSRIITGISRYVIDSKEYVVISPSPEIMSEAYALYQKTFRVHSFEEDWLTPNQAIRLSVQLGLIKPNVDDNLVELEKTQEDVKCNIFQSFLHESALKPLRKQLQLIKNKIYELTSNKHMFHYVTSEGFASLLKTQYILMHTTYDNKGNRMWKDWDIPYHEVDALMGEVNRNMISHDVLRYLSHNDPWRNYYFLAKDNPFQKHPSEWTDEQRMIMSYSKMYDNILEHPECPTENILNDDDALDGWMIHQRRQREKDKTTNEMDKLLGDKRHHQEIFIPVKDEDGNPSNDQAQIDRINSMNTIEAKIAKAKREAALQHNEIIAEQDLPDVRQDMQMRANEEMMKGMRR
jgi:hypothetical protein